VLCERISAVPLSTVAFVKELHCLHLPIVQSKMAAATAGVDAPLPAVQEDVAPDAVRPVLPCWESPADGIGSMRETLRMIPKCMFAEIQLDSQYSISTEQVLLRL
jgi:hypothetical protein